MDPAEHGLRHFEFKANKYPVHTFILIVGYIYPIAVDKIAPGSDITYYYMFTQILSIEHDREHGTLLTHCALTYCALIQVWALPSLEALHEIYCPQNLTSFARLVSNTQETSPFNMLLCCSCVVG